MLSGRTIFRQNVEIANHALRRMPILFQRRSWKDFWEATRTIPSTDLPGFLAAHRDRLEASRYSLSYDGDELSHFPSPVNTPFGFSVMSAFLNFAKWDDLFSRHESLEQNILAHMGETTPAQLRAMREERTATTLAIYNPKIVGTPGCVYPANVSFNKSVETFLRLAAARNGDSLFELVNEHPDFIWIEGHMAEHDMQGYEMNSYGKWVVPTANLDEAADLSRRLFPEFRDGNLTSAKFRLSANSLGVHYFLAYSPFGNMDRRDVLSRASAKSAFFVSDSDTGEAQTLACVLQDFGGQLRLKDFQDLPQKRRKAVARLEDASYAESLGVSDVQRRILLAVLNMNGATDPEDRFVFTALPYFDGRQDQVAAVMPILLDPQNSTFVNASFIRYRYQLKQVLTEAPKVQKADEKSQPLELAL